MNEQEFAELAAAAALDALSPDDRRRYDEALVAHPEWQEIADADAATAALLGEGVTPVAPPVALRSSLLAQIARTPQDGDAPRGPAAVEQPRPDARPDAEASPKAPAHPLRFLFALAACLALLVGVGIGTVALNDHLNRPASVIALDDIRSAGDAQKATVELADGGVATAHWSASLGKSVLVTDGIPALADGKTYELWYVRGDTPIPAGVFDADAGEATAVLAGEMHAGDVIAVTIEEAGGSPTGTPTTDPVIVIPTA